MANYMRVLMSTLTAVLVLLLLCAVGASSDPPPGDAAAAVDELKRALAVLAITICEAARFPRIRGKIQAGWVDGTYLDETDEGYIANWRTFSCAVRICDKYRRWPPEEGGALYELFGIWNCDQAREEIDMLLQANNCSKPVDVFC
ncbi:hypothetical protein ACP70R_033675 [Stipagrostis hirtigluma subsp. patula]